MFRISQYMQEIAAPTALGPKRNPPGPVVIWNLIRRCNLTCKHCYSISADTDFAGELSFAEVCRVMDDLKAFHVPVLILSGGEPLLRPDYLRHCQARQGKGLLRRPLVERYPDHARKYWPDRRVRFQLRRCFARRHSRNARQIPPYGWRIRGLAQGHPPVSRSGPENRRPLHDDPGQCPRSARFAQTGRR